jgi:adenosylmethionine-8-amino-7-oxononanoate aminotransferase
MTDLQRLAKDHLWLHFTRMGGYGDADVPIIVRGDGCHLSDANGKRYIDALAGLYSVNEIVCILGDVLAKAQRQIV